MALFFSVFCFLIDFCTLNSFKCDADYGGMIINLFFEARKAIIWQQSQLCRWVKSSALNETCEISFETEL